MQLTYYLLMPHMFATSYAINSVNVHDFATNSNSQHASKEN